MPVTVTSGTDPRHSSPLPWDDYYPFGERIPCGANRTMQLETPRN